jgi:hypothetical protein
VSRRTFCLVTPGPFSATDTYIVYHVTHYESSGNVTLHTRSVSTCVGAGCGRAGEQRTKAIRCGACYYSIVLNAHLVTSMADIVMYIGYIFLTYDMYTSSLRHKHDPELSSLKMKGTRFYLCSLCVLPRII